MEIASFAILSILALLGWGYWALQQEDFWSGTFDLQQPRPVVKMTRIQPAIRKNLGMHSNPLALRPNSEPCTGLFEQRDARTWQCQQCHLLHFEKAQENS